MNLDTYASLMGLHGHFSSVVQLLNTKAECNNIIVMAQNKKANEVITAYLQRFTIVVTSVAIIFNHNSG